MIKILFDHQIFSEQHYGGISRYFANIVHELNKTNEIKAKVGVLYSKNYYLRFYPQLFNNPLGRWFLRKDSKRYRWNKKYSKSLLKKSDYDIFHATYYDNYSLSLNEKPLVVTIHDMIYENSPEMFQDSGPIIEQKKNMMEAATAIIAISNFTRQEIVKFYPQHASKISVIYHGFLANHSDTLAEKTVIPEKFILFVGERGNYKNFKALAHAIAPLLLKLKDVKLVCAGGKKFTAQEEEFLLSFQIRDFCIQVNVNDQTLTNLYQQAMVFVYPSSQEGFGLPILEAFHNNCPIACSNQSCLPEIGGDAVAYFDPNDGASILSTVTKVCLQSDYANELVNLGHQRLKLFTMENCIKDTIRVYQNMLAS